MAQKGGTYQVPKSKGSFTYQFGYGNPNRGLEESKINGQESVDEKKADHSHDSTGPASTRTESFPKAANEEDEHGDDKQWVVVANPEDDKETKSQAPGFSSQFGLDVGWGKWKCNVLKWDIDVREHGDNCDCHNLQKDTKASGSQGGKEDSGNGPK